MAGLKRTTRKLLAARKKGYAGAMYHEIKKYPNVVGARKSAAEALKRLKTKMGSKGLRRHLTRGR